MRRPLLLFVLALCVHALWALTIPAPVDWDPAYYREVAGNIAAGQGAVTHAGLLLGLAPLGLPQAADLHWSPLPSRVLVPGLWLWPAYGDQLTTVLLAALWAPIAHGIARALGGPRRAALWAGLLAASGLGYARFLSTPDSIAVAGVCGGLALLALARHRWGWAALALAALALTRGEGLLLSALVGSALLLAEGRRRAAPALLLAASGPVAWAAWQLRCWWVGGQVWLAQRRQVALQLDYAAFVRGEPGDATLLERLGFVLEESPDALLALLLALGLVGVPLALVGALSEGERDWRKPAVLALGLGLLSLPPLLLFLAPAVAASGSVYRSCASLAPATAALAGIGLERAAQWGAQARGYPRGFVLVLGLGGAALLSLGVGWQTWQARPSNPVDCAGVVGPTLASDPLSLADRCGVDAWLLPQGADPQRVRTLLSSQGILSAHLREGDGLGAGAEEGGLLLGWAPDSQGVLRPE